MNFFKKSKKGKNEQSFIEKTKEVAKNFFDVKPEPVEPIDFLECDPVFKDGKLDYVSFTTRQNDEEKMKVMRLIRIKGTSSKIREAAKGGKESLNEISFKEILKKFGNVDVSFIALFASKPGKDMIISYGVIMEDDRRKKEYLIEKTKHYIGSLEDKFRSSVAYRNIEIIPFTDNEDWIFTEGLTGFKKLSLIRGIPKPDTSGGAQVGTTPYGKAMQDGSQGIESFLQGTKAKIVDGKSTGIPFIMCAILNPIDEKEIKRVLYKTQDILGGLRSSREKILSESENYGFPFLFGVGSGSSLGFSESQALGFTESEGIAKGHSDTKTVGTGTAEQLSTSEGTSFGETRQIGLNQMIGEQAGRSGGLSYVGNYTESATGSFQEGMNKSFGENETLTRQNSIAQTTSTQESYALANTETQTATNARSVHDTKGVQEGQNENTILSGGMSAGDSTALGRRIVNELYDTAIDVFEKYESRTEAALRVGMYDMMMFVLTPDEEAKIRVDELIKRSYISEGAPMPIKIEDFKQEEERLMLRYAKTFTKPKVKEYRKFVPDAYRYSTYITPSEASAFSLPQVNLEGYTTSYEPVPESIKLIGEMEKGARIGKQIHPHFNVLSNHTFELTVDKLKHIGIYGSSGVGKTVFTQRFIAEIHNKFGINVMLFDWTRNHRSLMGHLKNPEKFKFNSFDTNLFPFRFNPLRVPKGVPEHVWVPTVAELFCYLMGLGSRSFQIIIDVLEDLLEVAKKKNAEATMQDLVKAIDREFERRQQETGGKMDFNEISTFRSMKDRLKRWLKKGHPVFECLCGGNFINVEDMVRGEFVHLIECNNLPEELKQFVINTITAGIFYQCKFYKKLQKPVYLIFEEAHAVLQGPSGNEALQPGETIFEIINREARNYNLFVGYICQSPELLHPKIFDNTHLRVVFQLSDEEGKRKIISAGGRDPMRLDVDLVKWLSRQPMGTCVIRSSIFEKLEENEFIAVRVDMLPTDDLEDDYFKKLYMKNARVYSR